MNELRKIEPTKRSWGDYLTASWVFEGFWEKLALLIMLSLGIWKILNLIFGI